MKYIFALILLLVSAIESVSYHGYINKQIGIDSYLIYIFSSVLLIITSSKISIPKLLRKIYLLGVIALSILYILIILLETINYPNYIFSNFHINPLTFQLFTATAWWVYFLLSANSWVKALLLAVIIYISVDGFGRTLGLAGLGISEAVINSNLTYSEKMTKAYPGFYPVMKKIASITPQDATLYIPPQSNPWELEGNAAMVRYFLYPRKIINLDDQLSPLTQKVSNSYLLISRGTAESRKTAYDYGWPKNSVDYSRSWQISPSGEIVSESYNSTYNPADNWEWGLLELEL